MLNDAPLAQRIPVQTRKRVTDAAKALRYHPNFFARSLSGKRSRMIGVLAPDFGDGYDAILLSGMERPFLDQGYIYFVSSHLWSKGIIARSVHMLLERGAEGLILVNTPEPHDLSAPCVSIGAASTRAGTARVRLDNLHAMHLCVDHLVELGHRDIAFLKGHRGSSDTEERMRGGKLALKRAGLTFRPELLIQLKRLGKEGLTGIEEGQLATKQLLARGKRFTALIAFNDMAACGAIRALQAEGLRVPQDVSVIGFDDLTLGRIVQPALTTIRQPLREMGRQAALRLIETIAGNGAKDICVAPDLILRESTGLRAG